MKRLTLILTILVAAASCALSAADAPKRNGWRDWMDRPMEPLYGNVESVTVTSYFLKDSSGVLSRSESFKLCYNFNESGDVTERVQYTSDGSLYWREIYKYDTKGNKTEAAEYKSDGSLSVKYTYKYDAQGNVTEKTEYVGKMRPISQVVYTIIYRK
jgi:hypothetical protein